MKAVLVSLVSAAMLAAADEAGRIMRPPDKAAFHTRSIEIIATAANGTILIDGAPVAAKQPFPNVLHTTAEVKTGVHTLTLSWQGGTKTIEFYSGPATPAGFSPFRPHPPGIEVSCTKCHEISRRGRFVFKGGCFDCHDNSSFATIHTHTAEVLTECGLCHNAHGSVANKHLIHSKEVACKQCHN